MQIGAVKRTLKEDAKESWFNTDAINMHVELAVSEPISGRVWVGRGSNAGR